MVEMGCVNALVSNPQHHSNVNQDDPEFCHEIIHMDARPLANSGILQSSCGGHHRTHRIHAITSPKPQIANLQAAQSTHILAKLSATMTLSLISNASSASIFNSFRCLL